MRLLFAPIVALSLLTGRAAAGDLPEPEIWFNPHGPADILNLWSDDAPWQQAANKVQVLVLVHWWLNQQSDETLIPIFEFAKRHHMKIDLSTEPVRRDPGGCGLGEGYSYAGDLATSVRILARLGVRLDWVDMDEPLWWGHYSLDPTKCQLSIQDLISRTAMNMRELLAVYPNVRIMQVEPIPSMTGIPTWKQDETAFRLGLYHELGVPIRIVQVDIQWNDPAWKKGLLDLRAYLRSENMGLGIIYDGSDQAQSDTDWINTAVRNMETIEGTMHVIPDEILFTSWNPNPQFNLPETSPAAQTWWINRYFRPLSSLDVHFMGRGAHGRLTTRTGKAVPNATVNAYKPGADFTKPLPVATVRGTVPANAASALFAVRVNAECGGCGGLNDLLLGSIQYNETAGGIAQASFMYPTAPRNQNGVITGGEIVGGVSVTRIIVPPGQSFRPNSGSFPVTPGAQYSFAVPASTIGGVGWNGYVYLIWLGANGEISRVAIKPDPGKALMSTAVTKPDGTFVLPRLPRSVEGANPVWVEFDGGETHRSSVWMAPH